MFKGPITSTGPKGTRTWNFTKKSRLPEPGTKVNIPASKINHQIIADQYGIDVELIKGKDWIEILEVLRRSGLYAEGGLAEIMQAPRRGRVVHPGGYSGSKWTEMFRDLGKAGGSSKDFSSLYYKMKSQAVPIDLKELMIHEMMMSGALPSELKHGGLAGILEV